MRDRLDTYPERLALLRAAATDLAIIADHLHPVVAERAVSQAVAADIQRRDVRDLADAMGDFEVRP